MSPGSILVTIETSSVWTPLFNIAKAVVTDVGGILSHSAILGREYGLPVISFCGERDKETKDRDERGELMVIWVWFIS